jgi:hypothetical protein
VCLKEHGIRLHAAKTPQIQVLRPVDDEKQKEKHAATQFFSSLLDNISQVVGHPLVSALALNLNTKQAL